MAFAPVSPFAVDGLNKFLSMTYHQLINFSVYTFAELGIADRLTQAPTDRGFTIDEILGDDQKHWNHQLLDRVLRACASCGIVQLINDDKHFLLTESGEMLTTNHPYGIRDHVRFEFGPLQTCASHHLPDLVRGKGTDTAVARVTGGLDFYALMGQPDQKEFLSIFINTMTTFSVQAGSLLATGVDFGRFKTIVDLGGSRGTFLAEILQTYPSIEYGIVFDLPHIINEVKHGEDFRLREIHQDRWSFASGDMFDASTIPFADAYVLKHILHDFNDEKCLEILSSIHRANEKRRKSPVTIFISDFIILGGKAVSNWQTRGIDVAMAILFDNGRERTQEEYDQLLKKTGFQFEKLYPIQAPGSIIEATSILSS